MKNLFTGLCWVLLSVTASAQTVTDSLYLYDQNHQGLQFSKLAASQLLAIPVARASTVQLQYLRQNGSYRTAQTPQKNSVYDFSSEGIATLNRFKVSGHFSYSHTSQDSLAWTQEGMLDIDRPYYFASQKAGPYVRDNYHMGGQLVYNLGRNNWFIGSGINYLYNTSTRSVDPRPLVKTFRLVFKPEVIYKWNSHIAGAGITWGNGYEENGLSYANSAYQQNATDQYKPWITYLVTGYGSAYPQRSTLTIIRNQRYKGFNLSYSGNLSAWNVKFAGAYLLTEENNKTDLTTSLNFANIADYQVEQLQANLLASKQTGNTRQQVRLYYQSDNGSGFYSRISAKNYYMDHKKYEAQYSVMLVKYHKIVPEFYAGAVYENISRRDLSVYASNNYTWLQPRAGTTIYNHINTQNMLSLNIEASIFVPLKNLLVAPESTITEFTKGVVYPDFYYYKSMGGNLKTRINYISSNMFNSFHTGVSAFAQYNRKLSTPEASLPAYFIAGNSRLSYSISLNLYF